MLRGRPALPSWPSRHTAFWESWQQCAGRPKWRWSISGLRLRWRSAAAFQWRRRLTRLARGRAFAGRSEAEGDLQEVRTFFSEIGCTPGYATVRRALERAAPGESPRPAPASPPLPDGLTAREVEVVTLVCQGLADREIGARLFISVKTVDRHLRNIFNKTGVSNRAALAAYAARHGLLP